MEARVLIVDDNEMMQSFLQYVLGSSFHVNAVCNGEEALAFLEQTPDLPHAVLADFDLEGINGLDLLKALKDYQQYRDIVVVILSGKTTYKTVCLDAGADGYIVKPFIPAELKRALTEMVKPGHLKKMA